MTDGDEAALDTLRRQFLEPDDEYSPIPFWFWNDQLEEAEIVRQIRDFRSKGVAGFVIHPRMGLSETIPYLSDTYFRLVEAAVEEAKRQGMKVILYDEAMYPSGSAMGMVVKEDPSYASRGLRMIELPYEGNSEFEAPLGEGDTLVSVQAVQKVSDLEVDPQSIILLQASSGKVAFQPPIVGNWSVLFFIETYSLGTIRGVYAGQDDRQPGAPPSADLLNPQATAAFIRLTHEAYYARLNRHFGSTVIAMFTDEPNVLGRGPLPGLKPWTRGFLDYALRFGLKEEQLAALWLDAGSWTEHARDAHRKAVAARLAESFYQPLSVWCAEHGIQLTGHPSGSDDIGLLKHFQLPGQDVVWRYIEPEGGKGLTGPNSTLGKCSSDAARHRGRRRNLNECFGACFKDGLGWNFTADDMKWYMDWLFVRGVNLLSPHAFYYSLSGSRKHERPPDVGPNSIWWPHYRIISSYMKRMSWLMTDSVNAAQVAVLCEEDRLPWEAVLPLYENQIEFNYLEEELLVSGCEIARGHINFAGYSYTILIVDDPARFEAQALERVAEFERSGGTVIRFGEKPPEYSDATVPATDSFAKLPDWIDSHLSRKVRLNPSAPQVRVSTVRKGGSTFYLFVNEGEEQWEGKAELATVGYVEKWDPWEAVTAPQPVLVDGPDSVQVSVTLERRASVVYAVDPSRKPILSKNEAKPRRNRTIRLDAGWSAQVIANISAEAKSADSRPAGEIPVPAELRSWTEWDGMQHFSGTVEYTADFQLEPSDLVAGTSINLDLGDIHELAEAELNGTALGVRFWKPYFYTHITAAAQSGTNYLTIRITNSLANAYNGASLPSGLIGPVIIEILRENGE